ncbi:hypothetical protein [Acinetobacter nosocomialis]|uniref:hypothetical protein n=1 Tax=Acinetobacter nosocomialis TaxID=106654 RepID=UPI0024DE15F7|nr:hypothetical protein [Acinetobacter nosocomialis]
MSEFKVGDKVVFKSSSLSACVKNVKEVLRCAGDYYLVWKKDGFHVNLLRHATPEEIAAGHRIDFPTLPKPVGSLQELHPEFAKVLHENFLELLGDESDTVQVVKDAVEHGHGFAMVSIEGVEQVSIAHVINPFPCEELGDGFPIENRISPLCKSKDV